MYVPGPMKWVWWSLAGVRSWMIFKRHLVQLPWSLSSNQVEVNPLSSAGWRPTPISFLQGNYSPPLTSCCPANNSTVCQQTPSWQCDFLWLLTMCWPAHSQSLSSGQGLADFPKLSGLLHDVTQYRITVCLIQNTRPGSALPLLLYHKGRNLPS